MCGGQEKWVQSFDVELEGKRSLLRLNSRWQNNIKCDVCSTVHHSIELFHLPTLMYNSLFINNTYVTLLSSTCFEH